MSNENTATSATATAPAAPVVIPTRIVNLNGRSVTFLQGQVARGDNKGKPYLVPSFAKPGAPALTELVELITALGQGPIGKKIAKVLRDLTTTASLAAFTKLADGRFDIDSGKFVTALLDEVADLDSGNKDQLESELEAVDAEFNKAFGESFANFISKGLVIPKELTNKISQLMVKREQLKERLVKGKKTKKADAAAPATATAAAPAA